MKKYVLIGDGESVHLLKWAKELSKYFDLYLISFRNIRPEMSDYILPKNTHCFNLKISSEGGNVHVLKQLFKVNMLIRKINPDIVNPHYITAHGLIAAMCKKFFGGKYFLIQSTWGSDILVSPFRSKVYNFLAKFTLNNSNLITSDSKVMTEVIHSLTNTKVDTFTFGIEKLPEIEWNEKDKNLYFSNRALTENYNIELIIRLFNQISKVNTDAKLIISNDGHLKSKLQELVHSLNIEDKVVFKGFLNQDEQNEIYRKAQFYLSLPNSDSTSVSLLEAMSFGCIPILSNLPANLEWVEHLKNGIIFKKDVDEIQNIIEKSKDIFDLNRKLIEEKAIFSKSILGFLESNNLNT